MGNLTLFLPQTQKNRRPLKTNVIDLGKMDKQETTQTDFQTKQGGLKELFEHVKPMIWAIKVLGKENGVMHMKSILTGFAVNKKGYIVTCTHSWHTWESRIFLARRLCDANNAGGFDITATLVGMDATCDVCLLKVPVDLDGDAECGKFASVGKLGVGRTIISMGHPYEFVGSGLTGCVTYPCLGFDEDFDYDDKKSCRTSTFTSLAKSPSYRTMGQIWNVAYFKQFKDDKYDLDFEKKLQANVPIIQCAGLVGGDGISGAPMFNLKGEIVGMFVLGLYGYDIGIHAAAIKRFLDKKSIFP